MELSSPSSSDATVEPSRPSGSSGGEGSSGGSSGGGGYSGGGSYFSTILVILCASFETILKVLEDLSNYL